MSLPGASESRPGWAGRVLVALLHGYQRWISPALGPRCRFYPSCSAYAVRAIELHGAARGSWLALCRLVKCQPFHPGGIDYVPPPTSGRIGVRRRGDGAVASGSPSERGT